MQRQSSRINQVGQVAKAGVAGVCSIYLVTLGIFLLIPGPILIASSNDPSFQDDFFKSHNE